MKIQSLHIQNITVFEDQTFDFCDGINVFIGANSTGKTHALKAMYWLAYVAKRMALDPVSGDLNGSEGPTDTGTEEKFRDLGYLQDYFRPTNRDIARLVRSRDKERANSDNIVVKTDVGPVWGSMIGNGVVGVTKEDGWETAWRTANPLYFTTREMLTLFPGFVAAWDKRESGFDRTYRDICVSLDLEPLREGGLSPESASLIADLTRILGGPVRRDERGFYIEYPDGKWLEAHLLAEGHRKLAMLVRLIANGEIGRGTLLFWDEPESSLNPRLITQVAKTIRQLAAAGVQVFLATHDYLLTAELSLAAKYDEHAPPTRFFAFHREKPQEPVAVEVGKSIADLQHNPIVEEFAAHYDRERDAFYRSAKAVGG